MSRTQLSIREGRREDENWHLVSTYCGKSSLAPRLVALSTLSPLSLSMQILLPTFKRREGRLRRLRNLLVRYRTGIWTQICLFSPPRLMLWLFYAAFQIPTSENYTQGHLIHHRAHRLKHRHLTHIPLFSLFTLSLEIILTYLIISFPILPQIRRDIWILIIFNSSKK